MLSLAGAVLYTVVIVVVFISVVVIVVVFLSVVVIVVVFFSVVVISCCCLKPNDEDERKE